MAARSPTLIGSVQRALRLLELVWAHDGPVTAKALARRSGQPLPTTYHLLRTLVYEGYLQRVDGGYVIGDRVAALSEKSSGQVMASRIRPALNQLHDELSAAAYLSVYDDGEIRLVDIVDSSGAPRVDLWVGFHDAAHATALGKCVLACLPETERTDYVTRHDLADLTPHTITSRRELLGLLARQQDLACDQEEYSLGVACVATPVITPHVVGAVAVSVPTRRLATIVNDASPLIKAAQRLSLALADSDASQSKRSITI